MEGSTDEEQYIGTGQAKSYATHIKDVQLDLLGHLGEELPEHCNLCGQ